MTLSCVYIVIAAILPLTDRIREVLLAEDFSSPAGISIQDVFEGGWGEELVSTVEFGGIDSDEWVVSHMTVKPVIGADTDGDIIISPIELQSGVNYLPVPLAVLDIPAIGAVRKFGFSYADTVNGVDEVFAESVLLRFLYEQLNEGKESARLPKYRAPLLRMLSEGIDGTDFDTVYGMLLKGFPGPTDEMRIKRLAKWLEKVEIPKSRGYIYRGETRYWINAGRFEMAIAAADRMQAAYPEYTIRAHRLRALSYASLGELDLAKKQIYNARKSRLPEGERLELLYLEAWVLLQENDTESAKRNLLTVLKESGSSTMKRKAKYVLDSLKGD